MARSARVRRRIPAARTGLLREKLRKAHWIGLAGIAKTGQTSGQFNNVSSGGTLTNHSKLVQTRRRKQRAVKDLAGAAKRAKKLGKQNAKEAGAGAPKSP
jgi:hypothetical protein